MVHQNSFVEAYNYVKQMDSIRENKIQQKLNESIQKHKEMIDKINDIRESREMRRREHSKLLEDCKNDALATVIKAIYIEALQPEALTDNAIIFAESLVDSWIKSKGGASRVIAENRNKTYLLNRLCTIAEEAALKEAEEIEGMENEESSDNDESTPTPADDKKAKVTELMAQAQALIAKATAIQNGENVDTDDNTGEDTSTDDTTDSVSADDMSSDEGETSEDSDNDESTNDSEEESDDESEDLDDDTTMDSDSEEDIDDIEDDEDSESDDDEDEDDSEEDNEDSESDDDENVDDLDNDGESDEEEDDDVDSIDDDDMTMDSDSDEDIDDMDDAPDEEDDIEDDGGEDGSDIADTDEEPTTINGTDDEGNPGEKGQIFDDLEQEEDVKKAVEIISQRVADAEEDFVKRNAEDKKKIDDLIGKISDNIKTVEKISDDDAPESKVAEESVRMYNRQIKNITENRPQKVFEKIVRKLTESAVKDKVLKEAYTLDDGKLDIGGIIESAKVMYGFLEALNTLQLERVDKDYIANVIKEL